MFYAYRRRSRLRQGGGFPLRGLECLALSGLLHRTFNGDNFAGANLTSGCQIVFYSTTWGLSGTFGLLVATSGEVSFATTNLRIRVASMT